MATPAQGREVLEYLRSRLEQMGPARNTVEPIPRELEQLFTDDEATERYVREDGTFGCRYLSLHAPFRFLEMMGVLDAEGRAVREGRALPHMRPHEELKRCPYADSRHHHERPMNVTALRSITLYWKDCLTVIDHLRTMFLRDMKRDSVDAVTLYRMTRGIEHIIWFLMRRRPHGVDNGAIHPMLSGLFKAALGMEAPAHMICMEAVIHEMAGEEVAPLDAKRIYAVSDTTDGDGISQLIGPEEVCAGPPNMILELAGVLVNGLPKPLLDDDAEVHGLIQDWFGGDRFRRYTHSVANLSMLSFPMTLGRRLLVNDIVLALRQTPSVSEACAEAIARLEEWVPEDPHAALFYELDDEDRAVAVEWTAGSIMPPGAIIPGDRSLAHVHDLAALWRADLSEEAEQLVSAWRRHGNVVSAAAELHRVADRLVRYFAMEHVFGQAVIDAERGVREAAGHPPLDEEVGDRVIEISIGDAVARFAASLGVSRSHDGGGVTLRCAGEPVVRIEQ